MTIINARADTTSAFIEAILTALCVFMAGAMQWIMLQVKARRLYKTGSASISEADLRDTINIPIPVFLDKRCWTFRESITAILAAIIFISKPTVLLGTRQVPCPYNTETYAYRTDLKNTLCYEERPIPTSGEAYAALGARFVELIDVEPDVPLREHPSSFDIEKDEITGDGILVGNEIWGVVESIETCPYNISYPRVENSEGFKISASTELLSLMSDGSTQNPPEIMLDRLSRFGYLRDREQTLTAISLFKEIGVNGKAVVFMLTGLIDESMPAADPVDSHCIKITFAGQGLRTLPFANTAVQLMRTGGDMMRVAEVAWLGATLSEQIPRQVRCIRSNFNVSECVKLSSNTVITISIAGGLAVLVGVFVVLMFIVNWKNPVAKEFTQFNLLLSAIHEKNGGDMVSAVIERRVNVRVGHLDGKKFLRWDMDEESSIGDNDEVNEIENGRVHIGGRMR